MTIMIVLGISMNWSVQGVYRETRTFFPAVLGIDQEPEHGRQALCQWNNIPNSERLEPFHSVQGYHDGVEVVS